MNRLEVKNKLIESGKIAQNRPEVIKAKRNRLLENYWFGDQKTENNPRWKPENHIMETRTCICGCGRTFECVTISKKKFIHGHNSVGPKSEETKQRLRKPASEEAKRNMKIAQNRQEVKEKHTGSNNHNWKPEKHIFELRYCACGCGQSFECSINSKKKYVRYHNGHPKWRQNGR